MKKSLKFLLLCALLGMIASCKKKEYTCGHNVKYMSPSIIFKGFSSNDLAKVVINKYQPNGQFNQLTSTDTFDYSTANFVGDTAFYHRDQENINTGFISVFSGNDYTFTVLATNDVYRISNIRDEDTEKVWTQDSHCSSGSTQTEYTHALLDLNGQPCNVFHKFMVGYLVCLSH